MVALLATRMTVGRLKPWCCCLVEAPNWIPPELTGCYVLLAVNPISRPNNNNRANFSHFFFFFFFCRVVVVVLVSKDEDHTTHTRAR